MNKTEYIGFHSPKTAGCTTVSINTALIRKQISTGESIAFLQLGGYGDLDLHLGMKPLFNLAHLASFVGTDEWKTELLTKVSIPFFGIDFYHSPELSEWKNLTESNLKKILELLSLKYEKVFIDFGSMVPEKLQKHFYSILHRMVLVGTLSPSHFRAIDIFRKNQDFSTAKVHFCLNQCPKDSIGSVKKQIDKLKADFLGIIPQDMKACWYETYEGLPCALQKRSILKKALIPIAEKL